MLLELRILVRDPNLCERIRALEDDTLRFVDALPDDIPNGGPPPILIVDRDWVQDLPDGRLPDSGARVIYIATADDPDERAQLLAAGCLGIVDGRASDPDFGEAVRTVAARWRQREMHRLETERLRQTLQLGDFITASPSMARFMAVARRVSGSDTSVLILGETGVGKERLAAAIHAEGPRRKGPMIVVNCGAIPESLLESELFGHERGSFTGANRTHRGYFELAHGGTIFLDEIGEMPVHLQVKLLRVVQQKEVQRIGAERTIPVDIRVMAATNRELQTEVDASRFRSDLYYRLSVVTLQIPPLRERKEDIPFLVESYLERYREELGVAAASVSHDAMQALCAYHWPGNVREVINVMERAVLLCDSDQITRDELPDAIAAAYLPEQIQLLAEAGETAGQLHDGWFQLPLREARQAWNVAFEKMYLEQVLREVGGRIGKAAERVGVDPRSLYTKMRAYGLRKEDYR